MIEGTYLDRILAETRKTVAAAKAATPLKELERLAAAHKPRGFAQALRQRSATGPAIIAEVKKASPSKGLIRPDFDPEAIARSYLAGGAACLSVLTDAPFFQGSLRNLELASTAVPLPCLRKDFMIDEYQMAEARAHHADAILLITAALSRERLKQLAQAAHNFELDILLEVHSAEEIDFALDALGAEGVQAFGVNNRDLKNFVTRIEVSLALADSIPAQAVRVTESGIGSADDIRRLRAAGFDAFLIGESLMRQSDSGAALAALLAGAA